MSDNTQGFFKSHAQSVIHIDKMINWLIVDDEFKIDINLESKDQIPHELIIWDNNYSVYLDDNSMLKIDDDVNPLVIDWDNIIPYHKLSFRANNIMCDTKGVLISYHVIPSIINTDILTRVHHPKNGWFPTSEERDCE